MTHSRIPILLLGLMLAAAAHAELPASLTQAAAQLATAPAQRQTLAVDLEGALKAGAEEQDLLAVMRLATMHKYSAAQAAAFVQKLAAVRRDGLPVALVRDKILEGMAKKVPSETILAVASKWQEALKDARSRVQAMEEHGLKYGKGNTEERAALINLGAGLQQRYGAKEALSKLAESGEKSGRMTSSAGSLIAAGNLADLLFLHNATLAQALELPSASLRAGYTSVQILALQRSVLDQLRQGMAPVDVVASLRRQFGPEAGGPPAKPPFATPGQPPGGGFPGGAPGGGFPGGGAPGGGFPGGGTPGGGFPGGGAPGGGFPGGGAPGGGFPGGGAPGGGSPQGGGGY